MREQRLRFLLGHAGTVALLSRRGHAIATRLAVFGVENGPRLGLGGLGGPETDGDGRKTGKEEGQPAFSRLSAPDKAN
jgi:hypothetical protein